MEHSRDIRGKLIDGAEQAHISLTSGNYFDLRGKIEAFFAEYVDLLRAFALRNAGFTKNTTPSLAIYSSSPMRCLNCGAMLRDGNGIR